MIKQRLQQKLSQKLSPQQIQLIKLLEVPTIQLEQRIKKEIEENPTLEEGADEDEFSQEEQADEQEVKEKDELSIEEYIKEEDETPSYKLSTKNYSKDDKKETIPFSVGTSFNENLKAQLGLRVLSERELILAEYILGNIDEDGYLREDLETISDQIVFAKNIEVGYKELQDVLRIIQNFDPPGIGAQDLQESLVIQIRRKLNSGEDCQSDQIIQEVDKTSEHYPIYIAYLILRFNFDEFTKKHYDRIIKKLNITEEDLKDAINQILKLDPKPGSSYSDQRNRTAQYVMPDFLLENHSGELQLTLNQKNVPELRISRTYSEMLLSISKSKKKTSKDKDAAVYVKQKLDSAKWFIDAIKQRQNTLLLTMNEIINYQNEYFQDGDETKLRPMILKDIAETTELDISTISRVANSKYIQTHFGIFPLKYFFSEGMQTDSGEEVSTREIKIILKECIDNESKKKPLTDEKLGKILNEKGYPVARRTVAKYREQLNIPVARLRKEI
ncbi:MAG: RNA polymerase factor sigma-54 [Bacteroidetes bacterium]|mgnify:CR=1 FL=1|jgi:RNA polymerase sigma-54 factor|nr:RNA polymerase factor sigma-54 [Bacteroidota bacterium]MBT6687102.1 RNA polymerase factor sigma-54 [Bacteroidota bacterium]MBT7144483.1 RNA polymerase factor sigma-54 [Bacteroidota bacterium]MBT7490804.1 RNA polymerase factor sigma-54 [Bacteroidota bacterium]